MQVDYPQNGNARSLARPGALDARSTVSDTQAMERKRMLTIAVLAAATASVLAGCANGGTTAAGDGADGPRGAGDDVVGSGSCIDYIAARTPAERSDLATLVVDAEVTATDRTVEVGGVYEVRRARITGVEKGDSPGRTIDVISPSDQCTTSGQPVEYLEGDPLAQDGTFRLYLHRSSDDDVWQLVVPGAAEPITATATPAAG